MSASIKSRLRAAVRAFDPADLARRDVEWRRIQSLFYQATVGYNDPDTVRLLSFRVPADLRFVKRFVGLT